MPITADFIEKKINQLYVVFKQYPKPERVFGSPISVNEGEDLPLLNKHLKSLCVDDFGRYPSKAMSTWGTDDDFKYFLPRILELTLYSFDLYIAPSIFFNSLLSLSFSSDEQQLIDEYLQLMWDYNTQWPGENIYRVEQLIEHLNYFLDDMDQLVYDWAKKWIDSKDESHFERLVRYIDWNWVGIFYESKPHPAFLDVILESKLQVRLEEAFFRFENSRPDFAQKVSKCEENLSNYIQNYT